MPVGTEEGSCRHGGMTGKNSENRIRNNKGREQRNEDYNAWHRKRHGDRML